MDDVTDPTVASGRAPRGRGASRFEALLGRTLAGRYELSREIGEGGFGVVFEARDLRLGKRVAVKVLAPSVAEDPDALARFEQEATAAASIGHEGIVDVTDFCADDGGLHFLVMEYIDGVPLDQFLRDAGALDLLRALAIGARVAQALAAAHAANIIHRDLKPANIMLTSTGPVSDFAKVLDFGISKIIDTDAGHQTLTGAGQVIGTPRYMAPEQGIGSRAIDGKVDVYALGTILFEMVTGQAAYSGHTPYELMHYKVSRDPLPPSVVKPDLERATEVDRLVLGALAREPEARPTMAALAEALQDLVAELDPSAAFAIRPAARLTTPAAMAAGGHVSGAMATVALRSPDSKRAPALATPRSTRSAPAGGPATPPTTVTMARPGARWLGLALVAGGVLVGAVLLGRGGDAPVAPAAAPAQVVAPGPYPAAPTPSTPATPPTLVELVLDVEPEAARVELDGVAVVDRVLSLERGQPRRLVVSLPGFETEERELRPVAGGKVEIRLVKVRESPRRPRPGNPSRLPDSPL